MNVVPEFSFWGMLTHATIVVKCVLIMLGAMSLGSWYLIFRKFFQLRITRAKAIQDLEKFDKAPDLVGALRVLKRNDVSPLYPIGHQALIEVQRLEKTPMKASIKFRISGDNLNRVLEQGISRQVDRLSASLSFLATCANAAPFIGLFGTVWGIMHSFHSIGQQKSAALATVAPGISEALVATAIGLAVAIPATIAYNYFLGVVGTIEKEFSSFAGCFLNRAQRELPWLGSGEDDT